MTQYSMFDDRDDTRTPRERFEGFDAAHPEVYEGLLDLCRRFRARGHGRWSIDAAFHVLRWERRVAGLPDASEDWKLNNNYTSFYARKLMDENEDLDGIFELRRVHAS